MGFAEPEDTMLPPAHVKTLTLHLTDAGFKVLWEAMTQFVENESEIEGDEGTDPMKLRQAREILESLDRIAAGGV